MKTGVFFLINIKFSLSVLYFYSPCPLKIYTFLSIERRASGKKKKTSHPVESFNSNKLGKKVKGLADLAIQSVFTTGRGVALSNKLKNWVVKREEGNCEHQGGKRINPQFFFLLGGGGLLLLIKLVCASFLLACLSCFLKYHSGFHFSFLPLLLPKWCPSFYSLRGNWTKIAE